MTPSRPNNSVLNTPTEYISPRDPHSTGGGRGEARNPWQTQYGIGGSCDNKNDHKGNGGENFQSRKVLLWGLISSRGSSGFFRCVWFLILCQARYAWAYTCVCLCVGGDHVIFCLLYVCVYDFLYVSAFTSRPPHHPKTEESLKCRIKLNFVISSLTLELTELMTELIKYSSELKYFISALKLLLRVYKALCDNRIFHFDIIISFECNKIKRKVKDECS